MLVEMRRKYGLPTWLHKRLWGGFRKKPLRVKFFHASLDVRQQMIEQLMRENPGMPEPYAVHVGCGLDMNNKHLCVLPGRTKEILQRTPDSQCVGVEIGVYRGDNAAPLLRERQSLALHLVDPWMPPSRLEFSEEYVGVIYKTLGTQAKWNVIHNKVIQRLKFAGNRVVEHRATSVKAAEDFAPESLDWVFIDGNHSYRARPS
jgi:hypothetical protein